MLGAKNPTNIAFADTPSWTSNIKEEYETKDNVCARALLTLALLNGPTDIAELVSAIK